MTGTTRRRAQLRRLPTFELGDNLKNRQVVHRVAEPDANEQTKSRADGHPVQLGYVMCRDPELPGAGTGAATALARSDPPDDLSALGVDLDDRGLGAPEPDKTCCLEPRDAVT